MPKPCYGDFNAQSTGMQNIWWCLILKSKVEQQFAHWTSNTRVQRSKDSNFFPVSYDSYYPLLSDLNILIISPYPPENISPCFENPWAWLAAVSWSRLTSLCRMESAIARATKPHLETWWTNMDTIYVIVEEYITTMHLQVFL